MTNRSLDWPALRNARDLGGLPLSGGGETRFGAVVRSETLRQLTPVGWHELSAYGVATLVDLRLQVEVDANDPFEAGPVGLSREPGAGGVAADGRPPDLRTIHVSVLGEPDRRLAQHFDGISRAQPDEIASTRAVYLEMLALYRTHLARAVATVADAPPGGVLVHCYAGKDRTGLVVALLLSVAAVQAEAIAADYALSGPNVAPSLAAWVEEAADPKGREHRRRIALAPERAMLDVLGELDKRHGGTVRYLAAAGLTEADFATIRERLVA